MTGKAQEVISRLKCMKCHKFKEKQMKDYHSCQFKVVVSDLPLHQSLIFGLKLAKLTSSNENLSICAENIENFQL